MSKTAMKTFSTDVENLDTAEINALEAKLASVRAQRQNENRTKAQEAINEVLEKYGFKNVKEVFPRVPRDPNAPKLRSSDNHYRDPATGKVYKGIGPRPNWLKTALAKGVKLEDLKVDNDDVIAA